MSNITVKLNISSLKIVAQSLDHKGNIVIEVKSENTSTKCHKCGKDAKKRYGTAPVTTYRHLPIFDTPVYLKIHPVRYQCQNCDDHPTTTEKYDWCSPRSNITKGLEEYLMKSLIHSTIQDVSRKEDISYKTIRSAVDRQVDKEVDWSLYKDLETLGIDEISMKKGHNAYVTIISAISKKGELSVLAVLEGRDKAAIKAFLKSIPGHLKKTIKTVCSDMYEGFINAVSEVFNSRVLVVDRYHVAKLYRTPLDKLRIKEMQRLKKELPKEEYQKLEGAMWTLRKDYECLNSKAKESLEVLYKHSPELKAAHKHALNLTHIFNTHSNRKDSLAKIDLWILAVENSELKCFDKFIKTLKKYKTYIANYFKKRKNSGFVEGLNNKIKVAKRRCYGFFKTETLFQRLFLDLNGFKIYA